MNKEQEIWRTYPDYPFIEASNFGRVKTVDRIVIDKNGDKRLIKGRVLKQYLTPNGYMQVAFGVNGKLVYLLVHRVVASSHLPNPNNLPEVNHIDNDPTNNRLDNLEWCSREYNETYKKNFGTSQAEIFGRPVFAVNLKTGKILWFESQHEAARQLCIDLGSINRVIKGKLNQAGGYWFTEDKSEITEEKIQEIRAKMLICPVIAINLDTSDVSWFESQSEAEQQLGVNKVSINRVVKGYYNKAGGYWFCYADENAVEKVRERFGDKVAKKVDELMKQNKK